MMSVDEALAFLLNRARPVESSETVSLADALSRVNATARLAPNDVPAFANSEMDGYAVVSAELQSARRHVLKVTQRVTAGSTAGRIGAGEAARIFTGAPLPAGADSVIIQEDCELVADEVGFLGPVKPGQHVRPRGNNIKAGMEVLPRGVRLRPQDIGIAASIGLDELDVFRRLKVGFFSSGDELVEPGESLPPGKIYNSNRYVLLSLLRNLNVETVDLGIVRDDLTQTVDVLREASRSLDVVITSGGVSVGEEDHIRHAVESVGELELWSVAVKPGKPLAYGRLQSADFLGLPGNPVSTLVTFCLFVRPFLLTRQGVADVLPDPMPVRADFDWPKPGTRREYVRARLARDEQGPIAAIYPKQGSDVLLSTVWAEGLIVIPEHTTIAKGDVVNYLSFSDLIH